MTSMHAPALNSGWVMVRLAAEPFVGYPLEGWNLRRRNIFAARDTVPRVGQVTLGSLLGRELDALARPSEALRAVVESLRAFTIPANAIAFVMSLDRCHGLALASRSRAPP